MITSEEAKLLLEAINRGRHELSLSLDLHLTRERVVITGGGAVLRRIAVRGGDLEAAARRDNVVFALLSGGPVVLDLRGAGYAKLAPTGGAPTLELSGIKMHRSLGIDPFDDAKAKAAAVVRAGDRVLDTCGGLGYTALWARRLGARGVLSVEIEQSVVALRRCNPWSLEYLDDGAVEKREGDVEEVVAALADSSFDCVVHDPPRFSLAGSLYGLEFCRQVHRVLVPRGRLMFYTGEPYRRGRGRDFVAGVGRRLDRAGIEVQWRPELRGFVAVRR